MPNPCCQGMTLFGRLTLPRLVVGKIIGKGYIHVWSSKHPFEDHFVSSLRCLGHWGLNQDVGIRWSARAVKIVKKYISTTHYITYFSEVILSSSSCSSFRNAGKHVVSPLRVRQIPLKNSSWNWQVEGQPIFSGWAGSQFESRAVNHGVATTCLAGG